MNRYLIIASVLILLLSACAHKYINPEGGGVVFRLMPPVEAAALIEERSDLQIVDTRTGWERSSGWIANSVHISYFSFLFGGGYDKIDKQRPVLLICAHGVRSYRVGRALIKRGWEEVYDLEDGMKAWRKEGYPVVSEKEELAAESP